MVLPYIPTILVTYIPTILVTYIPTILVTYDLVQGKTPPLLQRYEAILAPDHSGSLVRTYLLSAIKSSKVLWSQFMQTFKNLIETIRMKRHIWRYTGPICPRDHLAGATLVQYVLETI
ncbi:hypothetical protein DPMN_071331 [Dreissena polymorpha]|uniref:Uncharacterized protein n=1 Tax=Dreissena polymorpha TaxID=45954 RepID=A0A9D3Z7I2_DREPO|nr:hypothetical protein DPMN_071331 [Dreissena polymorpha]